MARAKLGAAFSRMRGKVGNLVVREVNGRPVVSQFPDRSAKPPTEAQQAHREAFRRATFYGKGVMGDPDAQAFYEPFADRRGMTVYAVSVGDFLNAPVVGEIDASAYTGATGDAIRVVATDDVEVTEVVVALFDGDTELESGPATLEEWRWVYEAQTDVASGTDVTISARAFDRPGNDGELSVDVTTP